MGAKRALPKEPLTLIRDLLTCSHACSNGYNGISRPTNLEEGRDGGAGALSDLLLEGEMLVLMLPDGEGRCV